jgi:hypothetical protein
MRRWASFNQQFSPALRQAQDERQQGTSSFLLCGFFAPQGEKATQQWKFAPCESPKRKGSIYTL